MCGRFELHTNPAAIALAFGLSQPPAIAPRYNIAPTQDVPVVRETRDGDRELAQVRWGLVPRWAKDPSIGVRMINARAETLAAKPAFRNALKWHRCLLPADGFYEWKPVAGGKQPYRIAMQDGAVFALAGLTERWLSPDGEVLDTCAIVTTPANALMTALHDRMPLIIAPEDYARWLDRSVDDVVDLLTPYPAGEMSFHAVSTRVNAVKNDDPSIIDPIEVAPANEASAAPDDTEEEVPTQASLF